MKDDLEAISHVITTILEKEKGPIEISIGDIKVTRKDYEQIVSGQSTPTTQNINVQVTAQAAAQASSILIARFTSVRKELTDSYKNDPHLSQIEKKLDSLHVELNKPKPNKNKLKSPLKWAIDFGWDVFLKIAPLIIEKLSSA